MRRRPSTATAGALVALVVALSGTAVAEPVVNAAAQLVTGKTVKNGSLTGRDVKDRSLTGKDVKNRSLTPSDFRGSVRGPRGATGATGPTGPTGPQGVSGVTNVLRLDVPTAVTTPDGITYEALTDVGLPFTKAAPGSRIKLTWNGLNRGAGAGSWFCDFQMRVDDREPAGAGGRALVVPNGNAETEQPAGATALFEGLPAGEHQVEIWVRSDPSGTTDCTTASRGFADAIYVEELPG